MLILQGGQGKAGASDGIAAGLAEHYTLITYDRRGLSRSTPQNWSLEIHVEDASRPLAECAGGPARHLWIHQCASCLSDLLGADLIKFPGGHAGFATHPRAFGEKLREALS